MDRLNNSGRVPTRDGADPQLPNYMRSSNYTGGSQPRVGRSAPARSGAAAASANQNRSGGGQPPRGGGGSQPPRRKRPTRAQRMLRLALVVLGIMLAIVGVLLLVTHCKAPASNEPGANILQYEDKTYFDGVSIAGVDVSGKSIEQARGALQQEIASTLSGISISMASEESSWAFTSGDMGIGSDVEEVLLRAMAFGRDGTLSENAENKDILKETGKDFPITFAPSRDALVNKLNAISGELSRAPVEPQMTATLNDKYEPQFELQEGQNGRVLNVEATADAIISLVESGDYQATVAPVYDELTPTLDTEHLRANTAKRGGFSTKYSTGSDETTQNRVFNIHKAGDIINNLVLQVGEEWSFNGFVGLRTAKDGWKVANGISGGKEYTPQVGGGICQVSTTLYNALLNANIEITDRRAHSIPSSYVETGLDATVDSGGIDFKFRNNTNAPLYVFVYYTKPKSRREEIHVMVYGEPLPEGVTYKGVNEIILEEPNTEIKYVDDPTIPYGYELSKIESRPRIEAEAYLDKYVNGELAEHTLLYKDTYRGNKEEIHIGTGNPFTTPAPAEAKRASVKPTALPAGYDASWETAYYAQPQQPVEPGEPTE